MTEEIEELALKGLREGVDAFLIPMAKLPDRYRVPGTTIPTTMLGKPLMVCRDLMECVEKAVSGRGWILNPDPFDGLIEKPSDNDGNLLSDAEFKVKTG